MTIDPEARDHEPVDRDALAEYRSPGGAAAPFGARFRRRRLPAAPTTDFGTNACRDGYRRRLDDRGRRKSTAMAGMKGQASLQQVVQGGSCRPSKHFQTVVAVRDLMGAYLEISQMQI